MGEDNIQGKGRRRKEWYTYTKSIFLLCIPVWFEHNCHIFHSALSLICDQHFVTAFLLVLVFDLCPSRFHQILVPSDLVEASQKAFVSSFDLLNGKAQRECLSREAQQKQYFRNLVDNLRWAFELKSCWHLLYVRRHSSFGIGAFFRTADHGNCCPRTYRSAC